MVNMRRKNKKINGDYENKDKKVIFSKVRKIMNPRNLDAKEREKS
jgi:hypothetical protein